MINQLLHFFLPAKLKSESFESHTKLENKRKAELTIWFAFITSVLISFIFFVRLYLESLSSFKSLIALPVFSCSMITMLFFIKLSKRISLASYIILFIALSTIVFRIATTGGLYSITIAWLIPTPLIATLMISKRAGFLFLGFVFMILFGLSVSEHLGFSFNQLSKNNYVLAIVTFVITSFVFYLITFYEGDREANLTKIRNYEKSLSESKKLAALGSLVGGLAHEINNPLAVVKGRFYILETVASREKLEIKFFKEQMQSINTNMNRIESIVSAFKIYSRDDYSLSDKTLNLADIISSSIREAFETDITKKIKVENQCLQEFLIQGNSNLLQRVFVNLIKNSNDALTEQNEPWIRFEFESRDETTVSILITDSGSGIPKEIAEKIMDPFFTTKELGQGTGIGLNLSYNIIKQHQGNLSINTEHPNTQFVIELPLKKI